jgi:membrane protease YdiL (CAAX protease family)
MERAPRTGPRAFINRQGHLRAGWRMAAYVGLVAACIAGVTTGLDRWRPNGGGGLGTLAFDIENGLFFLAFLAPAFIALRFIDRRPFRQLGLSFAKGWHRELALGAALGTAVITAVFLVLWATGLVTTSFNGFGVTVLRRVFVDYLVGFVVAGALEEIASRGYLLQALIEGTSARAGIVLLSLAFSLMHVRSATFTWSGGLSLFILGVILGLAYVRTRALWMPIGLHVAWNWTMACLWGMKVSGVTIHGSVFTSTPSGPDLLTGGAFGAEGSLVTSVMGSLLIWYLWKAARPSSSLGT